MGVKMVPRLAEDLTAAFCVALRDKKPSPHFAITAAPDVSVNVVDATDLDESATITKYSVILSPTRLF